MRFRAYKHLQFALKKMNELDTLMHMRFAVGRRLGEKFRQVGLKFSVTKSQIQAGQVVTVIARRIQRKRLLLVLFSRNGDDTLSELILKEMVESDIKHHGDAQECGQGRNKPAVFNFRQQGGRKAGAFTKLRQAHTATQAKGSQLLSYKITPEFCSQTVGN